MRRLSQTDRYLGMETSETDAGASIRFNGGEKMRTLIGSFFIGCLVVPWVAGLIAYPWLMVAAIAGSLIICAGAKLGVIK